MKNKFALLFCFAILALSAASAFAQGSPPASSPQQTFFDTVTQYFSGFNTNLATFQGNKAEIWTGADYVQNVNVANSIGIEYQLFKSISLESVTRNAGIAGTILSEQFGLGLNFVVHDTKLTAYVDGGYDFNLSRPYAAVGARVKKALTEHTFAGLGIETQIAGGKKPGTPILSALVGFTF